MRKVLTALNIIRLGLENSTKTIEEIEGKHVDLKRSAYAHLARCVDEYCVDTIISKKDSGFGIPSIAKHIGIEEGTVVDLGYNSLDGAYRGKNQHKLTKAEQRERDDIVNLLYSKGMRKAEICRQMGLGACVVNVAIEKRTEQGERS